ncbi:50S ribosomal subunit maturation GTPase RbgA (B. subtilis YlqF) [Richelia intracellularis HH01]|uniref:50S ribosomal subunit maturation GTPase RbgA (B. subtilis YlqF) n=1 Tax=Richelia intracellularis HH01 TaxID=1165094 RepID=M1WTH8_9NOST|nr:50S ribosomal subunit maturation GTPase RbgA (B. subtilis YlqF) [Richelia intracellularis HH01]
MSTTDNYKLNLIQWYPGHIAKAEKNLKTTEISRCSTRS